MLRTKVVCTLGPASASPEMVRALVDAGMNVARINMSHGSRADHARSIAEVRKAAADTGKPVAVLVDLAGPKIRVGELGAGRTLNEGEVVVMAPEASARGDEIPTTYAPLAEDVTTGDEVLLDDGMLELRVVGTEGDRTRLEVVRGG